MLCRGNVAVAEAAAVTSVFHSGLRKSFELKLVAQLYCFVATCQSLLLSSDAFGQCLIVKQTGGTVFQWKWYYEITTFFFPRVSIWLIMFLHFYWQYGMLLYQNYRIPQQRKAMLPHFSTPVVSNELYLLCVWCCIYFCTLKVGNVTLRAVNSARCSQSLFRSRCVWGELLWAALH